MNCTKCNAPLKWINRSILKGRIWYCTHCGWNFRRNILGKVSLHPVWAIGTVPNIEYPVLLIKKADYEFFVKDFGKTFKPLPNSKIR